MSDTSYYARKKKESDDKVQEALNARKERTAKEKTSQPSLAEKKKASDSKVEAALADRAQRVQSSLPSIFSEMEKLYNAEIDSYKGTKPTYGAYEDTIKSQRERRISISNLRNKVNAYRSYMDSSVADDILSTLDKMESGYNAYLALSKYKSEDEYNWSMLQTGEDSESRKQRQDWWTETDARVKSLEGILAEYNQFGRDNPNLDASRYANAGGRYFPGHNSRSAAVQPVANNPSSKQATEFLKKNGFGSIEELEAELDELKAKMTQYERGEGGFATTRSLDDYHLKYMGDDAFLDASEYRDYGNASVDDLMRYKELNDADTWAYDIDGTIRSADGTIIVEDGKGNYINPDSYGMNTVNDKLGLYLNATEEEKQMALGTAMGTWRDVYAEGSTKHWDMLTEDEVTLYYGLRKTQGEKAANKFLEDIQITLDQRATYGYNERDAKQYEEANDLEKILLNIATVPKQLESNVFGFVEDAIATVRGEEINPYSAAHGGMHYTQTIRGKTAEELDAGADPNAFFTWGDVYQSGMSVLDSLTAMGVAGPYGGALLAMGAAESEAYKLYQQGASAEQIAWGAGLAGAAEMLFESISIGNLEAIKNIKSPKTLGQWFKTLLVQGGVEASEEILTEIANTISNAVIMGNQSDWEQLVRDGGYGDAFKQKALDVLRAGLGGLIAGGLSSLVVGTASFHRNLSAFKDAGGKLIEAGGVDALKKLAMAVSGAKGTIARQANKVKSDSTSWQNRVDVGRLYQNVRESTSDMNRADIQKSLEDNGIAKKDAKSIADAMIAKLNGWDLTAEQSKLLESLKDNAAIKAVEESIVENKDSDVNKRRQQMREFNADVAVGLMKNEFMKKSTEKEFTPEGIYKTADNGKAIRTDTNEEIDIKRVKDIGRGKLVLELADGQTIDAKSVSFGSEADALIYEAVAKIGDNIDAESANQLIAQFKGGNAMVFARGIAQAYTYGFYGIDKSELFSKHSLADKLTDAQREFAYNLGKEYRPTADKIAKDNASEKMAKTGKTPGEKGVYFRDKDGNATDIETYLKQDNRHLNDLQKSGIEMMHKMSEMMGIRFNVFESWTENGETYYLDENGEVAKGDPNGFYDTVTGEIYIALNAGSDYQGTMVFTIAHEVTHFMRQWSPEHFRKIAEIVFQHGGMKGNVSELIALKQHNAKAKGKPISYDVAMEEVVADGMETILKNGKVVQFMADVKQKDHSGWQKLKGWFRNLAKFLRAYIGRQANTVEGRKVSEFSKDLLSQIEQIYAEGAVEGGSYYQETVDGYKAEQAKFSTANMQGNADGAVVQSDAATAIVESKQQPRTEYEAFPKQVMSLSDGSGTMLHSIEGLTPTKLKGLSGRTVNGYTGRDVRAYAMGISGFTQAQIQNVNKFMDSMAEFMEEAGVTYKFIGLQDVQDAKLHYTYNADGSIKSIVLSAMVKNGDYPVNFDLSSICKKREAMSKLIDNLAKRGSIDNGTVKLTPANIFKINTALKDAGYETACLGCFVESKRYNSLEWAKTFCNKWNAAVKKVNPNATYFDYGNANFNEDSFTLEQAIKIEDAANKYIKSTKTERLANALKKYQAKEEAGLPLVESLSKAARDRLVKSDTISDELKTKYLNSDVTSWNMADVEFLLENGVLPGASLSNKQAVTEMVKSGEAYQHLLRPSDLLTDRGISKLEALPNFHGVLYGHYGSGTPKLMQSYTPYNSEIALLPANKNKDQSLEEYLYSIAGVRMQSFSDFQVQNIYDYLQMVADLSARKLPAHAYTKEISFAKLLGMTGIKTNLSVMFDIDPMVDKAHAGLAKLNKLVHRGEYAKVVLEDEQGKWVYNIGDYQTQRMFAEAFPDEAKRFLQSIGFADAVKLQTTPGYSANCGIIGVGYSDLGIFAMLDDNRIRYIIPYHASSLPADIKVATNITLGTDYTSYQNNMKVSEITDRNGNKVNWAVKEAYKRLRSGQAVIDELNEKIRTEGWVVKTSKAQTGHGSYGLYENLQETNDPRQTASNYMEWCIGNGTLPVFYQFASHENYYKLIYDYNVYDCVTEEYAPQQAVTNTYPTMVDGQVQPGNVTEGGFNADYLKETADKQMAFMNAYNENRDADLEKLAENMEEGNYSLFSERVSNKVLAEMDETALYIKNTDKANYIGMIFNGTKTEETRSSRTLDAFIGKSFYVTDGMYVYGSIVLGEPHKYTEAEFHEIENQRKHRVPKGDVYDIKTGGIKWAYPIESHKKFAKPKKLSDSAEYKHSFQAREILYADKANLSKSEYDRLAKKKPIKVSDQEMALIRTQRKTEYASLDEYDIPIIDFFKIGDYRIINNGFVYYIRNSGPDNFSVVMRKQIVPDVRRITREVIKDENRSNDARTDQSAGQERGKRGLDRSGGDRTGNGRELSENDGGNVQSGESQRDLHTGQGDADSRTLRLRRIHDLSARIEWLSNKIKQDRVSKEKKTEYRRELRKVREELRELITGRQATTKMSDRDTSYLDAVMRGDMETAQRMVDEDAKAAGFPVRLFHGTSKFGFTKVDVTQSDDGISFFVSDNFDVSASYIPYYEGSEAYDRVREIGKPSKEEGTVLTAKSSVDELLDFLRKRYPDQYADSHIIKENERAKYIERYVSDAARYARELLQYSVPQNVEDLATSVIEAETDRSKWNALANSYKGFKGIHEITYNGSYFSQASDVWYTLQDRIRLLDLYANGELAIVRGIPESKEMLFYHYEEATQGENVGIYGLYGKEDGQLVIRGRGSNWNNIPLGEIISDFNDWWTNVKGHEPSDNGLYTRGNTRNIAEFAKYRGYRSVVFEDIYDTGHYGYQSELSSVYAYFFPQEDIKSADPVTYDDDGNVIPLSERFNTEKDDIRYSDRVLMGSLFSGGGTLEAGLAYQMLDKQFGVEYDGRIASVYADNHGDHIQVGKVEDFDISKYDDIFYLHASPVCHNFSKAKHGATELAMDINSAKATARHLEKAMPQVFTVENAPGYRKSESLKIITDKLTELGYKWDVDIYNSADYGSATSRNRVILRAVKDGELPAKPAKQERTNSWDKVTRDLWDTLPKATLRPSFISAIENTRNLPILDANGKVNVNKPLLILTTTSGHTVTYCWEGDICPTLTTKCGEARLVMPDGNIYAVTPEFMGRIQGLPDDYKYPKEKTRAFTIIGNGIPTHLTKAVVGGVLDSAYEQTHEGNVLYQDRTEDSVSNRSLLANAFEGIAKPEEQQKVKEYKEKVSLIDAEEKKLRELNEQIKELSFSKGPRDTKKIRDLRDEATMTANRISTLDKILLRLEAAQPLQDVLAREKKRAYDKAAMEGRKALDAYKEKTAKTQRELLNRWQESRKKAVESREKTVMRHKIQSVVGELNQLLLSEDKKRHVPDSLKKAVAEALALVNMDTVKAEERAAKYATLIAKETDPDKIDAYTITMENILRQGEKMGQKLKELRDAYEEIQNSDDPDIANGYDPAIAGAISELSASIGDTSLANMSIEQLSDVYDMYKMVLTKVRDANKSLIDSIKESISNRASRVVGEVRAAGGEHKYRAAILDPIRAFFWNNAKPVYAMEHIGSEAMTEAYNQVRKGEDTWAKDVTEARAYYIDKSKKYGYDSWDFDAKYTFESASGLEFELTLEQILSLYAYSKREQSHDHLRLGGFVFDSNIETYKDKGSKLLKYKVNTADAHQLTPEILANITGKLTQDQMAFVDEMQDYLSTVMGAKGNEVTMKMYGVKLFKEKFYFPLKSARQFMFEQNEVSGEVRIKNSGFTNKVVAKANNPVILSNFMDVWANHVNDMSMYHSFVLPLEDFNRIFNYNSPKQEGKPPVSVKGTIQSAYSPAAVNYIKQLITDLNGGAMSDPRETVAKSMMAKFKKAKVFSSLSVVIQQPSAIGRAFALVDPKYFHPTVDGMNHDELWAELKQYAPVAIIKEMGYFDTNMGKSTLDFIKAKEYTTLKEKAKAIFTDADYRDELLSKAPALADELTWCAIWNAVKRETLAKHPGLDIKSEPFLMLAGARFTEVITKTQVYDSVLARSANMRAKSGLMSMVTSFMAEPTTTINMVEDALRKGKRGYKGYAAKAFASVAVSVILNNALVALVYGMRDDDEDETFAEKYMQAFVSGMMDDINPLTYLPYLKDMWSLLQGYDVERSDISLVSDLADSVKGLVKAYTTEDGDIAEAWWTMAGAVANIGGVPMQNIRRDVNGAINFFNTIIEDVNGRATTWGSMGDALETAVRDSLPVVGWLDGESKADKLYDAIISGDTAYVNRLKGSYKTEDAYHNAVRKALRENDPRILEAAKAQFNGDPSERVRIQKLIIADGFAQDDVVAATNTEINKLKPDEGSSSTKAKGFYTVEDFAMEIANGDQASANAVKVDVIQTLQKNGKTAEEAEKSFRSSAKSELKDLYLAGKISKDKTISALTTYCGIERDDAESDIQYWDFKQDYPDVFADDAWIDEYYEEVESSGISLRVFIDYRNKVKGITGDNKKEGRMAVINSLPISNAQKDALYYAEGWAASKLYEAPWH